MKKFAENWWHKKGQYYDQDSYLYPKLLVIDTFMAGFDAGRVVGVNEAHPAVEEDAESCCTREAGECILKDFGLCGHGCMYYAPALNFNREES